LDDAGQLPEWYLTVPCKLKKRNRYQVASQSRFHIHKWLEIGVKSMEIETLNSGRISSREEE